MHKADCLPKPSSLTEAKRLLIHTPQSVKQIALQLGFEEATHFNKFFKKQQNTTPKAFRDSYLAAYGGA